MWDLSSPTRDQTHVSCSGSLDSQPLDLQGSLQDIHFYKWVRSFPLLMQLSSFKNVLGTSLLVQWLRLHVPNVGWMGGH